MQHQSITASPVRVSFTAAVSFAFKQRDALITAKHLLFSARATSFLDTSQAKCYISLKDKPGSVNVARACACISLSLSTQTII